MERKEIKQRRYTYFSLTDFQGDFNKVRDNITALEEYLQREHPTFHRFEFDIYTYDNEGAEVNVDMFRWETDEELNKRVEIANKQSIAAKSAATKRKNAQEAKEKEEYLRLKAKFEHQ